MSEERSALVIPKAKPAMRIGCAVLVLLMGAAPRLIAQQSEANATATQQLRTLEQRWNEAHLRGDIATLDQLWAEDLIVTVPEMQLFRKADLLAFWRTGRSKIVRYETSDLNIRASDNAAVVDGILKRERDFNGRTVVDNWRFTKTYFKRNGEWRVVSYHASPVPEKSSPLQPQRRN